MGVGVRSLFLSEFGIPLVGRFDHDSLSHASALVRLVDRRDSYLIYFINTVLHPNSILSNKDRQSIYIRDIDLQVNSLAVAFSDLPNEILLDIAERLDQESDISSLSQTSRHFYELLNTLLYRYNVRNYRGWGMWRAVELGSVAALSKFLAQGANVQPIQQPSSFFFRNRVDCESETSSSEEDYSTEGENEEEEDDEDDEDDDIGVPRCGRCLLRYSSDSGSDTAPRRIQYKPPPPYRRAPNGLPICLAARMGHVEVVKILIAEGADPNARNRLDRNTPLMLAARYGHLEMLKLLLAQPQIDPDPCSDHEREQGRRTDSPLISAIQGQHEGIVQTLLDRDVDPRVDNGTASALSIAAGKGNLVIVRMLLDKGAEVNVSRHKDQAPVFCAAREGHAAVVEMLFDTGVIDLQETTTKGEPLLSLAAMRGDEGLLRFLLKRGVDPNSRDRRGQTALDVARLFGNTRAVNCLMDWCH